MFFFVLVQSSVILGHGGSVEDTNGDEEGGITLCPADYPQAGQITEDDIYDEVGNPESREPF